MLLLAEDNPADVVLFQEALKESPVPIPLCVVADGEASFFSHYSVAGKQFTRLLVSGEIGELDAPGCIFWLWQAQLVCDKAELGARLPAARPLILHHERVLPVQPVRWHGICVHKRERTLQERKTLWQPDSRTFYLFAYWSAGS